MIDIYLKKLINDHLNLMSYINRKFDDKIIISAITNKARTTLREDYLRYKEFYFDQLEIEEIDSINKRVGFKLIEKQEEI